MRGFSISGGRGGGGVPCVHFITLEKPMAFPITGKIPQFVHFEGSSS